MAKSEAEAKKLIPEEFHKWIKVFSKKQSERMPTWKIWDHAIDMKEEFVPKKGKVYPLSREERGGVQVYPRTTEERVYQTLEVASNGTCVFHRKEGW